jgi:hypothetical protein
MIAECLPNLFSVEASYDTPYDDGSADNSPDRSADDRGADPAPHSHRGAQLAPNQCGADPAPHSHRGAHLAPNQCGADVATDHYFADQSAGFWLPDYYSAYVPDDEVGWC